MEPKEIAKKTAGESKLSATKSSLSSQYLRKSDIPDDLPTSAKKDIDLDEQCDKEIVTFNKYNIRQESESRFLNSRSKHQLRIFESHERSNVRGFESNERSNVRGFESNGRSNLRIFESNERNNVGGFESNERNNVGGFESYERSNVRGFESYERSNVNVATVKPVCRNMNQIKGLQASSEVSKQCKHTASERDYEDTITLPSYKIKLLNMFRFQIKNETECVKISLDDTSSNVTLKAVSFDELKDVKMKLFECLDAVVVLRKTLSAKTCDFLSRIPCIDRLQQISEEENVIVLYQPDKLLNCVRCYSFSKKEACKGIELLESAITKLNVTVNMSQRKNLPHSSWNVLLKSLDVGLTTLYQDKESDNIVIESLLEEKAIEAKDKITSFLQDNVKREKVSFILESCKARCYMKDVDSKIRQKLEQYGTYVVSKLHDVPLKIKVSVEGEECITNELKSAIDQIWQEGVDLSNNLAEDDDVWLMMRGLFSMSGKEFLNEFEQAHGCFIDMHASEDTTNAIPASEVTWDEWDNVTAIEDASVKETKIPIPGTRNNEKVKFHNRKKRDNDVVRFRQYQCGLDDDEALQIALLTSAESFKADERTNDGCDSFAKLLREDEEFKCQNQDECARQTEKQQEIDKHIADRALQEDILDNSAAKPHSIETEAKTRHLLILDVKVKLVQGNIAKQSADALVNVVSSLENPFNGTVSKTFLEAGGQLLLRLFEGVSTTSDCVVTGSSGRLQCSTVFHVKMYKSVPFKQMIKRAVENIFAECNNWACKSVALPALGIDEILQYPPDEAAKTIVSEITHLLNTSDCSVKQVMIVACDDETYITFDEEFQKFKTSAEYVKQRPFRYKGAETRGRSLRGFQASKTQDEVIRTRQPEESHIQTHPNITKYSPKRSTKKEYVDTHHSRWKKRWRSSNQKRPEKSNYYHLIQEDENASSPENMFCSRNANDFSKFDVPSKSYKTYRDTEELAKCVSMRITAENKERCHQAKRAFERLVKKEFLYEEIIEKKFLVSKRAETKVEKIVSDNDVKLIEGKDSYILKGQTGKVRQAYKEIHLLQQEQLFADRTVRNTFTERETHEFIEAMVKAEPLAPFYWKNYKPGVSISSLLTTARHLISRVKYEKVDLLHNRHVFSTIVKMMNATFDPSFVGQGKDAIGLNFFNYRKLFVLKVERIENLDLYEQFSRRKQTLFRKLYKAGKGKMPSINDLGSRSGGVLTDPYVHPALDKDIHPEINEHLLFHGTKETNIETICNEGLDPRICSENAMAGSGIYAAECATKADQYADHKLKRSAGVGNIKRMFLIRMVLGHSYVCTKKNPKQYRRPPCVTCLEDDCTNNKHMNGEFGHTYDSVVTDNNKLFREFVVYDSSLCYPEYLITYERR